MDEIVLYGIAAGPSDASGCCGPYSLKQIKEKGPLEIKNSANNTYDDSVVYHLCGKSINAKTGKYAPQGLYKINGPANLRKYHQKGTWTQDQQWTPPLPPEKSEIIGSCTDHSRVADLGSTGGWHHVYCEGKSGWTHHKNIRWPKP